MSRPTRLDLIKQIEQKRGSRLLVAVWGDRQNVPTMIASDVHPIVFEHLEGFGKIPKIDLLLYTTGGQTLAAWALANMIREYCDELEVMIPHRALSAGTLLTLAADSIVMSRAGQLSPIDPSLTTPLGPTVQAPNQPGLLQIMPISVEDVVGFMDLATKQAELKEERSILAVFDRMATQVHPLALGAVYRTREQIVSLADRLLAFHMRGDECKEDRDRIVSKLTRELGSHDYIIGRSEAKNVLKLNVIDVPADVDQSVLRLFEEYAELLELRNPFMQEGFLGQSANKTGDLNRAVVESTELTHAFRTTLEIQRVQPMPGAPTALATRVLSEGWIADTNL